MNTIGRIFRLTCAGESHGAAIVGIIDGMPAGLAIDEDFVQGELARRRPGKGGVGESSRAEADRVTFLSGVFEGVSTGAPISFTIANSDARPADYEQLRDVYRPNHADYTYQAKYGCRDWRGGGRASARVTAAWVVAGALAKLALKRYGVEIKAVGEFTMPPEGDTAGGIVSCTIHGLPAGLGEPVFGKFQACLAHAMMSINAAKGFEYGDGFDAAHMTGSESADEFNSDFTTRTNHSGGIQGGITNGMDVEFRVAFKPIATLGKPMKVVDKTGNTLTMTTKGRHDATAVPRAVPIVEALAAIVTFDSLLLDRLSRIDAVI